MINGWCHMHFQTKPLTTEGIGKARQGTEYIFLILFGFGVNSFINQTIIIYCWMFIFFNYNDI